MQTLKTLTVAVALTCSGAMFGSGPVSAMPLSAGASAARSILSAEAVSPVINVQFWGYGPYYEAPYPYYGGPYYYGHRRHNGAAAAAILGTAIIGGIIASEAARQSYGYGDPVAYCMRRYRSYDPYSRTFLGYDGYRHPCP